MKLLLVIPGFGPGLVDLKKKIVQANVNTIKNTFTGSVDIKVFNYGTESCGITCDEMFESGVVGQYLYKYVTPDIVDKYDYVLVLLDDIELSANVNIDKIIVNYTKYKYDILSPILTPTSYYSHPHMLQRFTEPVIVNPPFVEFFCYLMNPNGYRKWYNLFNEKSCWLWGIDLAQRPQNIRVGMIQHMTMHHHIHGGSYKTTLPCPRIEMHENEKRLGVCKTGKTIYLPFI